MLMYHHLSRFLNFIVIQQNFFVLGGGPFCVIYPVCFPSVPGAFLEKNLYIVEL